MANWLIISCKSATYLISKQQEGKLPVGERIQLIIHIFVCDVCKLFKIQTKHILHKIKHQKKESHSLSQEAKNVIAIKVNEAINNS